MVQDVTFTIGNVKVTISTSPSSPCPSSEPPEIITPKSSRSSSSSEKLVKLRHFSGTLKVSINSTSTSNSVNRSRGVASFVPARIRGFNVMGSIDESAVLMSHAEELDGSGAYTTSMAYSTVGGSRRSTISGGSELLQDFAGDRMSTPLHISCGNASPSIHEMQTMFVTRPKSTMIQDENGYLPLHLFAMNENVMRLPDGKNQATSFANELLKAYPKSVLELDNNNRIPFTEPICRWIEGYHSTYSNETHMLNSFRDEQAEDDRSISHTYDRLIPRSVSIPLNVEWCITMLSDIMDNAETTRDRDLIADNVASIPYFLKIVLLIDDADTRISVTDSSLFRRVLLCPDTVGDWMLYMLQTWDKSSRRCVDYFELISSAKLSHYVGRGGKVHPSDIEAFDELVQGVFERVWSYDNIIPSLPILPNKEIGRAVVTRVIWEMLDKAFMHPFVLSLAAMDIAMSLYLVIEFRMMCYVDSYRSTVYGGNPDIQIYERQDYSLAFILAAGGYFIIRNISGSISMLSISFKVFSASFFDISNLLMLASAILAIISASRMQDPQKYYESDPKKNINPDLYATTMFLLWFSLIEHLKVVSRSLTTYMIAVEQIFKDIVWFMIILIMAICLFADLATILTTGNGLCIANCTDAIDDDDVKFCGEYSNDTIANGTEWHFHNETDPYCSSNFIDSHLAVYTIILGVFNLDEYENSRFMEVLFICFTLFVVILMMNCLIAVVIESYQLSKLNIMNLYGRLKVDFAAEMVAFMRQLQKADCNFFRGHEENFSMMMCSKRLFWCCYRYFILLVMCAASGAVIFFVSLAAKQEFDPDVDHSKYEVQRPAITWVFLFAGQILAIISLIIILDFMFKGFFDQCGTGFSLRSKLKKFFRKFVKSSLGKLTKRLGISKDNMSGRDEETNRMSSLERNTNRIMQESETRIAHIIYQMEDRMLSNNTEMKADLKAFFQQSIKKRKKYATDGDQIGSSACDTETDGDDSTVDGMKEYKRSDFGL